MLVPYARAYVRHDETYLTGDATGAALWLPPDTELLDEEQEAELAQELEAAAGADAERVFELMGLLDESHPDATCWTLQLLAVKPGYQGRGIGSSMMAPVLARADRDRLPAYLEATSDRNKSLYERYGFETIGHVPLPNGHALTRMWREPNAS
jgi:GNAT superfamily N-acetyltransferase